MTDKTRINFISYAKCVAVLLVCMGHFLPAGNGFKVMIYNFHVPVFFVISGFLMKWGESKPRFDRYLWSKVKRIVIPYCFYFALSGVFWLWGMKRNNIEAIRWIKFFFFWDGDTIWNYALWFVPVMFVVSIVFYFLVSKKSRSLVRVSLLTLVCFAVTVYLYRQPEHLTAFDRLGMDRMIHMCGYMGVGFLSRAVYDAWAAKQEKPSFVGMSLISALVFIMSCMLICRVQGTDRLSLLFFDFNDIRWFIPLAIVASLSFLFMFAALPRLWIVDTVASNSLFIMGVHYILLQIWKQEVLPVVGNTLPWNWRGAVDCCLVMIALVAAYRFLCNRLNAKRIAAVGEYLGLSDK